FIRFRIVASRLAFFVFADLARQVAGALRQIALLFRQVLGVGAPFGASLNAAFFADQTIEFFDVFLDPLLLAGVAASAIFFLQQFEQRSEVSLYLGLSIFRPTIVFVAEPFHQRVELQLNAFPPAVCDGLAQQISPLW